MCIHDSLYRLLSCFCKIAEYAFYNHLHLLLNRRRIRHTCLIVLPLGGISNTHLARMSLCTNFGFPLDLSSLRLNMRKSKENPKKIQRSEPESPLNRNNPREIQGKSKENPKLPNKVLRILKIYFQQLDRQSLLQGMPSLFPSSRDKPHCFK